jgi:hypothetical protein
VPAVVLRPGRFDPLAILILWCLSRLVWPLLLVGLIVAWPSGRLTQGRVAGLNQPSAFVGELLSPWPASPPPSC